jgi:hypothetical protein
MAIGLRQDACRNCDADHIAPQQSSGHPKVAPGNSESAETTHGSACGRLSRKALILALSSGFSPENAQSTVVSGEYSMLRAISFEALPTTLPILSRGFPGVRPERWTAALDRLRRFGASDPARCAGYLLETKGQQVGIMLTIPSVRSTDPNAARPVVNLSSWYIDPDHRWHAPRMLQSITGCDATLYTDLTATPPIRGMIGRMGFRGWTEGTLIAPLPLVAALPAGASHVIPFAELASDAFSGSIRHMLDEHAALDCISVGLWDGKTLRPVIFSRKTFRGIPGARVIFTDDRAALLRHLPAIARFLLRQRCLLLAMNADRGEHVAGTVFMRRKAPTFYKGTLPPRSGDFAYSEYVFLQI